MRTVCTDLRKALILLAFAPFVLLQTLAPGTMLHAAPDGMKVVLCQDNILVQVTLDSDGDVIPSEVPTAHDPAAPCAWAQPVEAFAVMDLPSDFGPSADIKTQVLSAYQSIHSDGLTDGIALARAPPRTV